MGAKNHGSNDKIYDTGLICLSVHVTILLQSEVLVPVIMMIGRQMNRPTRQKS